MLLISAWWSKLISRRLRDITAETEHEQRRRIAEMEKDVTSFDDIQCMCNLDLRLLRGQPMLCGAKDPSFRKSRFRKFTRHKLSLCAKSDFVAGQISEDKLCEEGMVFGLTWHWLPMHEPSVMSSESNY